MTEEELKTYKVLKQLGWNGGVYVEGDTVEMEPRFAKYYINEKVLEKAPPETPAQEKLEEATPAASSQNTLTPTTELEEI